MQNLMTICPPIPANNTSKQYDSTQTPLALLEQTCRSIGADTSSSKSSSQSIDHTKKDHHSNGSSHKLHSNGAYKPSSLAINQLANLANNYEGGRRSGNSSTEYTRASVSPASANLASGNGSSRPNSNNGNNSRPNSNNSGNSSLTSTKGKELSFKPYEEQRNRDKNNQRKHHHSPELEHLKSINKNERKSSDSLNGLSPKSSINSFLPNLKQANTTTTSLNLSYAQQQQLFDNKIMEFQYQQYLAALAAGYPFNNNPSSLIAAAFNSNPLLSRNSNIAHSSSSSNSSSNNTTQQQQSIQQQTQQQQQSTSSQANSSITNCPPGCDSCIIHNPLLLSSFAAAQTPSSLATSNNNNLFNAHHLAALAQQYPQIPPNFFYGLAGYPSLAGLTPPVSTPSSSSNSNALNSLSHQAANNAALNSLNVSSSLNPLLNSSAHTNSNPLTMHQHSLTSSSHHHNSSGSNKSGPHLCTFTGLNNSICGKRFNTMDDYVVHLKSHSNINDFHNNSLNAASLESLYGSYEAMLATANNQAAQSLPNLRRPMHETLSNSRYHPYNKASTNNYPTQSNNSSAMLPPSSIPPFPLGALSGLNGLNNLSGLNGLNLPTNNSAAAVAAASFNNMYYGAGRIGQPTVQQ